MLSRASILVIATLLLGGCSDSPQATEPTTSSSSSASATSEPTPSPTYTASKPSTPDIETAIIEPPVLPEAAKEETEQGAIAFAEYFLEVLDYSANSGDVSILVSISDSGCAYCNKMISNIEEIYATGQSVQGHTTYFDTPPTLELQDSGFYAFSTKATRTQYSLLGSSDTRMLPAEHQLGVVTLGKLNSGWRIYGYGKPVE